MSFLNPQKDNPESSGVFTPREKAVKIETSSGTITYRIKELLASARNLLLFHTGRLLGESSGAVVEAYAGNMSEFWAAGHMIHGLYKNATPEELDEFIRETIKTAVVIPAPVEKDYDNYFCQYYDHQWPLIAAIYEQNFGGSIAELKKKLMALGMLTAKSSPGTTTSQQKPEPSDPEVRQDTESLERPAKPKMTVNHPSGI